MGKIDLPTRVTQDYEYRNGIRQVRFVNRTGTLWRILLSDGLLNEHLHYLIAHLRRFHDDKIPRLHIGPHWAPNALPRQS